MEDTQRKVKGWHVTFEKKMRQVVFTAQQQTVQWFPIQTSAVLLALILHNTAILTTNGY